MRTPALLAVLVALAAGPAPARPDDPRKETAGEGATPVKLELGQRLELCRAGLVGVCPLSRYICDDPGVAIVDEGSQGAELVANGVGQTLCAVYGYEGATRRLLRVTVVDPAAPRAPEKGGR